MAETWRVVLATGEVREVVVTHGRGQPPWTAEAPAIFGTSRGVTPWTAVARLALRWGTRPREILAPGEPTRAEMAAQIAAVTTERDVLRAQQAPLLDAHDALVAAARAAGWTGAGATGAELVAWVRRGEREACAVRCDAVAKGADNALPGREGDQRAYLKGRRRGAEVCAEALREGGE